MFKVNNKDTSTASVILCGHFYYQLGESFLRSVTKSNFRKYSAYNSALLKEFVTGSVFSRDSAFTVKNSVKVFRGVCFQIYGLFLIKLQVFAVNGSEGFYDGVCNGTYFQLQNMTDLLLENVQAFTIKNCFGRLTHETVILIL